MSKDVKVFEICEVKKRCCDAKKLLKGEMRENLTTWGSVTTPVWALQFWNVGNLS